MREFSPFQHPRDRLPTKGREQYTSSTGGRRCRGRIIGSLEIGVLISLLDPTLPLRGGSTRTGSGTRVSSRAFPSLKLQREGGKWNFDSFFFPKFSKRLFRNFDRNLFVSNPLTYNILFSNFFYSNADVSCWKILKN